MSQEGDDPCPSCFEQFNTKERAPKMLECYHTYCKSCLEQFMFQNGTITCLSCSKETRAVSVSSIPDNPYKMSGNGEEVYYSDSDDDDGSATSSVRTESVLNGNHVQGVKDMVLNTQKANVSKVRQLIDLNLRKIKTSKSLRSSRESKIKESLQALADVKSKFEEEYKGLIKENNQLNLLETNLNRALNDLNKVNLMDYDKLKALYDECLIIRNQLALETEKIQKTELELAVRQSTVKINFDATNLLLSNLNADNDTIFMKLYSTLENDPSMVFLTTFLLGKIFTDKIASHNPGFKEVMNTVFQEESISPQPLEDTSEYIDYVKSYDSSCTSPVSQPERTAVKSETNRVLGSDTSRSSTPSQDDKEWKVVGKEKKESKKILSFSEMAKKPGNPQPITKRVPFPDKTVAQTNRPHCYFKVQVDNEPPFRVVFEMRPDMAPKMVDNFVRLCKGLKDGRGYKGSKIFRAKANDHILGGDFENDDGTGGHSAYEEKYFLAEQCPLKDHKGAIRMKGLERTTDGRCKIGSQFMIWVGDLEYKEYRYTLVFGKVVEGFDKLQEVSRIKAVQKSPTSWVLRQTVTIVESGVL